MITISLAQIFAVVLDDLLLVPSNQTILFQNFTSSIPQKFIAQLSLWSLSVFVLITQALCRLGQISWHTI